ncbi:hypothetical protein FRC11_013306 [Ceratobasidium sp. 423]|nr:hypothetical protein FRC11_013306 [Ceratobasidium sp. 423]
MRDFAPRATDDETGMNTVLKTMQVDLPSEPREGGQAGTANGEKGPTIPHIYAIGDAADAFGAIKAGHTAHGQAEIAAKNIIATTYGD